MLIGHNIKFDLSWLYNCGFTYNNRVYDTMVVEYVLARGLHRDLSLDGSCKRRKVKLKKKYFHKDLLTDVISFNLEEKGEAIDGEIYISLERVAENSKIFEQDFDRECKRVIIHSILHLLGFDDQTSEDKIKMPQLEDYYLLNAIGVNQT